MEYQAKELFAKHGVTTTLGIVADTAEEVRAAAEKLGGVFVVKAQVKAGGRGKAGGVKVAKTPDEAFEDAANILGLDIKGLTVKRVMVAPATPPGGVLLLRAARPRQPPYLCSLASRAAWRSRSSPRPTPRPSIPIDPIAGIDPAKAARDRDRAKFPERVATRSSTCSQKLVRGLQRGGRDPRRGQPAGPSRGRQVVALDGKVSLDENAEFRHPDHEQLEDKDAADPLEAKAKEHDLNYVKLDGEVGIIGNGAGLVMSTLDVVAYAGENHGGVKPANFLDIGGGAIG